MTAGRALDYLGLMLAAAGQARMYTADMGRGAFYADSKTQDAVVMKLLVIGELSAKLLEEHRDWVAGHPQIPWRQMKGMRNRMAHGYFELDLDVVWDTVLTAIPKLESELRKILNP